MSFDLILATVMGLGLAAVAVMWVPPRRGSGLEPSPQAHAQANASAAELDQPQRIEPFAQATPTFADLVTIGSLEHHPSMPRLPRRLRAMRALGAKPGELVQSGALRRSVTVEVTPEQKRRIVLAAALEVADDTDPGDDDPTPAQSVEDDSDEDSDRNLSPRERANNKRAAEFRASQYGLVRLDGGVRWVGAEPERIGTLPPAAVEDDEP